MNYNVGETVKFGSYPQSDVTGAVKEPLTWKVLKVEDGKALLITEFGIDNVMFHNGNMNLTWDTCDMRKWLNGEFFGTAFSADEQAQILDTTNVIKGSTVHGAPGCPDTVDKVFPISIDDAKTLFASDEERACKATPYAAAKGAFCHASNGNCWWWLINPGYYPSDTAGVNYNGFVHESGDNVSSPSDAVRPAIWVK